MAIASVAQSYAQKQDAFREEGLKNHVSIYDIERNIALEFARQCVRDYADVMEDGFYLLAKDLPEAEKKILLSYAIDCVELYEEFIQTPEYLQAAYKEYEKEMQYFINEVIDEEFSDFRENQMNDAGMVRCHFEDNGETFWVRRC
jgi:hypothetical protein